MERRRLQLQTNDIDYIQLQSVAFIVSRWTFKMGQENVATKNAPLDMIVK